jgi:site-specific DNA-methyltransferase (adenine-specific)
MLAQEHAIANQIIVGNCKDVLREMPANSVHLTITSPPYRNAIDYDIHVSGSGGYYRGKLKLDTNDYLEDMAEIFGDRLYRITKEGGYDTAAAAHASVKARRAVWKMEPARRNHLAQGDGRH